MARIKGSKNKNTSALPQYACLSAQERITILANLIVDKILADQNGSKKLFKKIRGESYAESARN